MNENKKRRERGRVRGGMNVRIRKRAKIKQTSADTKESEERQPLSVECNKHTVEWGWNYRKYMKIMWKHPKEPKENQLFYTSEE